MKAVAGRRSHGQKGAPRPLAVVLHTAAQGGAELHLLRVLTRLAQTRQVLVVLGEEGPLEAALLASGTAVEVVPFTAALDGLGRNGLRRGATQASRRRGWRAVLDLRRRLRVLQRQGYAVLFGTVKSAIPAVGSRSLRRAWVDVHEPLDPPYMGRLTGSLSRLLVRSAAGAVVRTQAAGDALPAAVRTVIIPPAVDDVTTSPVGVDEPPAGELRVLSVGRLSALKGQDRVPLLASRLPHVHFTVVGDALEREADFARALRRAAEPLDNVLLMPHAPPATLGGLYAGSDVLLALTRAPESYGLVLVEAMAHGCYVVAPAYASFSELLAGYDGARTFDPLDDVVDRVAAILGEIDAAPLRAGRGARRRAPARADAMAERYAVVLA